MQRLALAAVFAVFFSVSASAAPVTQIVTFTATDFEFISGDNTLPDFDVPPVTTFSGKFMLSYDTEPAGPTIFDDPVTNLVLEDLSIEFGGEAFPFGSLVNPTPLIAGDIIVEAAFASSVTGPTAFFLTYRPLSDAFIAQFNEVNGVFYDYQDPAAPFGLRQQFSAQTIDFTVVPLPAAAPLLATALVGIAILRRCRRSPAA